MKVLVTRHELADIINWSPPLSASVALNHLSHAEILDGASLALQALLAEHGIRAAVKLKLEP